MALSFSFGIHQTYDELSVMQAHGCYWVNIERHSDARQLCRQIITAQGAKTRVALICCGEEPDKILIDLPPSSDLFAGSPEKMPLYTLPEKKSAILHIITDLNRGLCVRERLLILFLPASVWRNFSQTEIDNWLEETRLWLIRYNTTILILNHGSGINKLNNQLVSQFGSLSGLSSILWQQDRAQYQVSWWFSGKGLIANQALALATDKNDCFYQSEQLPEHVPLSNDELLCLAEKSVLEGAPPLSVNWRLLENNQLLAQQGLQTHCATLVFALNENDNIATLAQQIHTLRSQRGSALKIVVREMKASLRYTDERLLQACGANLVVPHIAQLSSFLTLLEGIQGQRFTRHVPATIDSLLAAINPSQLKGLVSNETFCQVVPTLIENTLMPEDGKGILIALRPVPGLLPEQAVSLCHMRRAGDLVTATSKRIYLFLSNCRMNDLDIALGYIFRLPVSEAFSNRMVWHHDVQIVTEIKQMDRQLVSGNTAATLVIPIVPAPVPNQRAPQTRRQPQPLTLALIPDQGSL
ncbi:cellulose biosynthesis protein BcsE [Edaphovirga cremea]|uniref:cellulose biosynthesis protein BcsE n=1 Tax=Edaphovirga cremea TaxID=2267246 RepID=UPI000DEF54A6|nr:cellulose biosynthesis protein BcsE [Edaphovirga cremea]